MGQTRAAAPAAVSWETFLSTYLPALVLALGAGIALPAVPALAKSFTISFGLASGVITAFLLGNVVGTIPSGTLIDRFGRRPIMIAGPLLTALMAFCVALAHTFPELLLFRFLDGFASQMWLIARMVAISHGAAANQRGRMVSWMFGMDNLGMLAGPMLGGFIATEWGPRGPFVVYGMFALLALIPTLLFAQDTPRAAPVAVADAPVRKLSFREIIVPRLVYFGVGLFAGITRGPLNAGLLLLYAAFAYHLGPAQIGYLATSTALLGLPIALLAGWIMDRFGRKRTMVPGFIGVSLSMGALAASAFFHLSLTWYVVLLLLGVAMQALTGGSIQTIGADVAPPEARGTFLGLWRFTGQSGMTLSPIIFAVLADGISYGAAFIFIAASAITVVGLLIAFVPETRKAA